MTFMIKNYLGMDIYYFLNCFFIYSFLGYIFECVVLTCQTHSCVTNRGFVRCPLCTIYGVGAFGAQYLLAPLTHSYLQLFVIGAVAATLLEIFTAKLMTKLFGCFWWDYKSRPFNYRGVICLESTICWGVIAVAIVVVFHRLVMGIVDLYYDFCGKWLAIFSVVVYCIDFSTSFYRAIGERSNYIDAEPSDEKEVLVESIN